MSNALKLAHADLLDRYFAADRSGDWQERSILNGIVDVIDYASRISGGDSSHYRADKSLPLVRAALRVQREAFNNFADAFGTDIHVDDLGFTSIDEVSALVEDVVIEITAALWARARGQRICCSHALSLEQAVASLTTWVEQESRDARPDPEDWM